MATGITEQMQTILTAISAITTLVPAARICAGRMPQNTALPYIAHFPISGVPYLTHQGVAAMRDWDFYQVSIFARTYAEGDAIAKVVLANLPGVKASGVTIFPRVGSGWYQPDQPVNEEETVRVEHFPLDFDVWGAT